MEANARRWDSLPDGRAVDMITLSNGAGMQIRLVTFGATIISVKVPFSGATTPEEVTLCYDNLKELMESSPYYGCTVGRVANRIAKGSFELDGKRYQLATNIGANHLHGGRQGFDKHLWDYRMRVSASEASVVFSRTSPDGEEGYPGALTVTATYTLTADNSLRMEFEATTTAKTPVNICNHAYWNLSGNLREGVKDHCIQLECQYYLPVDEAQIPTGEVAAVVGTPFDLTKQVRLGDRMALVDGGGEPGIDHCFCRAADGAGHGELRLIATLTDASRSRHMYVSTTAPAVQLYTGNFLSKDATKAPHIQHGALCLETQVFPDAINHAAFPSCVLEPGQTYKHVTIHKFES